MPCSAATYPRRSFPSTILHNAGDANESRAILAAD